MNITLTSEIERFIQKKVSSGRFESPSDVIRAGLKLLEEQDRAKPGFMVTSREELSQKLEEGLESLRRGEYGTQTAEELIAAAREKRREHQNG